MILYKGDMWKHTSSVYVVTTNSYIKQNGELVMGRGAAKEAKERYDRIAFDAGEKISHLSKYGFIYLPQYKVGLFQVKYHWNADAELSLIDYSVYKLTQFADMLCGDIVMNFPGIGNGRLPREDVISLLEILPDNVIICEKD